MPLAERMTLLKPSPTLALTAKVNALCREGQDIVTFTAGEPDFNTPELICEAAERAIRDGKTKYTPTAGVLELRQAIANKYASENGFEPAADSVLVTAGAKQGIFNALMAICGEGDEVILIAPYWPTYHDQVLLSGAIPKTVYAEPSNDYQPSLDSIADALSPRTRAVIINSPNNPSGAVLYREFLAGLIELALTHNFYIISDEIYEKHVYDDAEHVSIASISSEAESRTITVSGVSKAYAMTGWRLGWTVAPREITQAMSNIQDQVSSHASSISQYASLAALLAPETLVNGMVQEFARRRAVMQAELAKIDTVTFAPMSGAFYAFVDVAPHLQFRPDTDVAAHLLENHGVACVPGSAFHGPGHLRLTYALSPERISIGVARIKEGLESLD